MTFKVIATRNKSLDYLPLIAISDDEDYINREEQESIINNFIEFLMANHPDKFFIITKLANVEDKMSELYFE